MPALSSYPNVYATAVAILLKKGFQVWVQNHESDWYAERGGWDFMADNPIELLGLVSIFEVTNPSKAGEYWWRQSDEASLDEVPSCPTPYQRVCP